MIPTSGSITQKMTERLIEHYNYRDMFGLLGLSAEGRDTVGAEESRGTEPTSGTPGMGNL